MSRLALIAVLLSLATAAAAFEPVRVNRLKPGQFEQLVEMIETEMRPGGSYEFVTPEQQDDVRKSLARIGRLLPDGTAVADLNEDQKVELFNAQAEVNAILTGTQKEQMICERTRTVGSNIPENRCDTRDARAARARISREDMERLGSKHDNPQR